MSFDSLATTYDDTFGSSPVGRLFRFRLSERVMKVAPPPARLLDIGCGTGEDALWFGQQGYGVHAIDASSRMIEVAREKSAKVRANTQFENVGLEEFSQRAERFDIVVSDFGALNCLPLATWSKALQQLLKPAGTAFLVLMGQRPLPEGLKRGFRAANRGASADVRVGDRAVRVEYPSRAAIVDSLGEGLTLRSTEALGCAVPGPRYSGFPRRHPIATGILAMGEVLLRRAPFFRDRGDHTLFEFRAR